MSWRSWNLLIIPTPFHDILCPLHWDWIFFIIVNNPLAWTLPCLQYSPLAACTPAPLGFFQILEYLLPLDFARQCSPDCFWTIFVDPVCNILHSSNTRWLQDEQSSCVCQVISFPQQDLPWVPPTHRPCQELQCTFSPKLLLYLNFIFVSCGYFLNI